MRQLLSSAPIIGSTNEQEFKTEKKLMAKLVNNKPKTGHRFARGKVSRSGPLCVRFTGAMLPTNAFKTTAFKVHK